MPQLHVYARMPARLFAAGLLIVGAISLGTAGCDRAAGERNTTKPAAPATTPLDLGAAVVIGASVSAGAEVTLPGLKPKMLQGDATLAEVLAAIAHEGGPPVGFADMMFFSRPDAIAEKQLNAALGKQPTMVFAIDYLFWHAYGAPMTDDMRRATFDKGLARLDRFTCPIVIADLPDMSHAVGMMLMAPQVPPKPVQEELNRKLEAWAAERPRVVLVKLRDVVAAAMSNQPVRLGGQDLAGEQARSLLTANGLHTTADGSILLALECLQRMKERGILSPTTAWTTDAAAIKSRLTETKLADENAKEAPKPKGKG